MIEPKCKRCGHKPCPHCMDWCDRILHMIICPDCDNLVGESGGRDDGQEVECGYCKKKWALRLPGVKHRKEDDISVELCCDGECDWDQDEDAVEKWCLQEQAK